MRLAASLRLRATAAALVAVGLVLVVAGVALLEIQRLRMTESMENTLRLRADDVTAKVEAGQFDLGGDPGRNGEIGVIQVVDERSGRVVTSSANIVGDPPIASPRFTQTEVFSTASDLAIDDDSFRVLSRLISSPRGPMVLHVAASLDPIDESLFQARVGLALVFPLVLLTLGAIVWVLVGRTLQPMEAIRLEAESMGGTDLGRRVPEPRRYDEVGRLARTMNGLLGRIEEASLRQARFTADASHELRSPLTRIRSELEVDRAHPAGADLQATHQSVLEETITLQRLVEDLLQLARSDGEIGQHPGEVVDLDDLVLAEARSLRVTGDRKIDTSGISAGRVLGDADQLSRVIRNLADNAMRHADSTVGFGLSVSNGMVYLTVSDDGPGVEEADRERVFERFSRLDAARSQHDGGTGLGLAIVREIARRHGGDVYVEAPMSGGSRFVVRLPADDS